MITVYRPRTWKNCEHDFDSPIRYLYGGVPCTKCGAELLGGEIKEPPQLRERRDENRMSWFVICLAAIFFIYFACVIVR